MNPSFSEYSIYFKFFKDNQLCLIPNYYNIPSKFLKIFFKIINKSIERITLRSNNLPFLQRINLENEYSNTKEINFSELLSNNRFIFFHGFLFGKRDFRLVEFQRKFLSEIFSFSEHIQKQCVEILRMINKKKVIGICMRQGDYKDHFDGKFYLNDNEYKDLILKLRKHYPDYGFFIACEENKNDFHINNAYISYQNPALNLCILSQCDFLIGPPSTFMTWAAFYKNLPICYIDKSTWNQNQYTFKPVTF